MQSPQELNPGYGTNENWNNNYLVNAKDTLERFFKYTFSAERGMILYEFNSLNGKLNGICIGYHTNGLIYSISYYLKDNFGKQTY